MNGASGASRHQVKFLTDVMWRTVRNLWRDRQLLKLALEKCLPIVVIERWLVPWQCVLTGITKSPEFHPNQQDDRLSGTGSNATKNVSQWSVEAPELKYSEPTCAGHCFSLVLLYLAFWRWYDNAVVSPVSPDEIEAALKQLRSTDPSHDNASKIEESSTTLWLLTTAKKKFVMQNFGSLSCQGALSRRNEIQR